MITTHGQYPGTKLTGKDKFKRLYHFTSFDTFVKIWLSGELLFGDVQKVNDLQESDFPVSTRNMQHWAVMQKFRELRMGYKQISLTMNYDSYLWGCMSTQMWAYYADKSRGVCIELEYDKIKFPSTAIHAPVKYRNLTNGVSLDSQITTTKDIKKFILRNKSKLFFTKQFSWKGENEYRIVSESDRSISISDAISCVYVTDVSSSTFNLLVKLINGKVPIKHLKFIDTNGLSVPVLTDAISEKASREKVSQEEFQISLQKQVNDKLEECKDDENKSLLMPYILLKN